MSNNRLNLIGWFMTNNRLNLIGWFMSNNRLNLIGWFMTNNRLNLIGWYTAHGKGRWWSIAKGIRRDCEHSQRRPPCYHFSFSLDQNGNSQWNVVWEIAYHFSLLKVTHYFSSSDVCCGKGLEILIVAVTSNMTGLKKPYILLYFFSFCLPSYASCLSFTQFSFPYLYFPFFFRLIWLQNPKRNPKETQA